MDLFVRLDAEEAAGFAPLTPKHWRKMLSKADPGGPVIALGGALLGQPVALGLAYLASGKEHGWVNSIAVARAFRRQGIGTALLGRLEEEMARQGATVAHASYALGRAATPAVEHILQKRGWDEPRPYHVACRVQGEDVLGLMQAPWMTGLQLPEGFEFFAWSELTVAESERLLQEHAETPVWEDGLDPFGGVKEYDPVSSVGLRCRGEVIGWMINQRVEPGLVRYTQLFVRREYRTTARGVAILAEAIRRQWAQEGERPDRGGVWQTRADNAPMVRFIKRRLGPYLTEMVETRETSKRLQAAARV